MQPLKKILKKIFYKPHWTRILLDVFVWVVTIGITMIWRTVSNKFWVFEYFMLFVYIFAFWFAVSYIFGRYKKLKRYNFFRDFFKITIISVVVFGSIYYSIVLKFINFKIYSPYIAVSISLTIIALSYIFLFLHYAYRYAANMDVKLPQTAQHEASQVLLPMHKIDAETLTAIKTIMSGVADEKSMEFIKQNIDIESSNTKILITNILANISILQRFRYDAIINLAKFNSIRGINEMLNKINEKLPDNGLFCCCYQSIEQFNKKIKERLPIIIREIVIFYFFITKRVLPKIFITNRLWFDITGGQSRVFSDVEMIGRLYYCGFEVAGQHSSEYLNWLIAKRTANPQMLINKQYGMIIKLKRVCKDKKLVPIYKMRTMYPYSEYIQKYMYEQQGTDDIGKIKDDVRITGWGKFFRKFWLDEIPMFWNLLKGDLKIVGVRPLSPANFSTYPQYLQDKRTKIKPGLIPPMYADLPKTEQEFYNSEERYVDSYLKSPLKTDVKYFFKAIYNILFKKARSH